MKKTIAKTIKTFTGHMADAACGAASFWGAYQMKEPKKIRKSK